MSSSEGSKWVSRCVFGSPPNLSELDELAVLYHEQAARNTRDYVRSWICPDCRKEYKPIQNMLVDLPPFSCDDCGLKNDAAYEWRITQCLINGVSLDFKVYDQNRKPHCTLYSVAATIDATRRVEGAKKGLIISTPLDVPEMAKTYEQVTGFELGKEPPEELFETYDNCSLIMEVVKAHGISFLLGEYDTLLQNKCVDLPPIPRLRIKSYFRVDRNNVLLITRLLASGYPLTAGMLHGTLYWYLKGDQYYYAPKCATTADAHAITLIGSGLASKNNMPETFYSARDSHGTKSHPDHKMRDFGADFFLWACDITDVWGLTLA
ncbi:uncharacterized protein [Oryza sativa Japonica Group]|uniref:uncharacterized protein n=1 Tax=Oryza sativa subsp. japonica TaxID=39947 RepID=UPI0007754903|nr:uncharacterized protein LOC9270094 [Oryza sativa Japonica Group]